VREDRQHQAAFATSPAAAVPPWGTQIATLSPATRDVIVTFSTDTWADAVHRDFCRPPEQLAFSLQADDRVGQLVVTDAFRSRAAQAVDAVKRVEVAFPADERTHLVRPRQWSRRPPMNEREARSMAMRYDDALAQAVRMHELTDVVVITTSALVAGFAPMRWAARVVFYARDDWAAKAETPTARRAFDAAYEGLRETRRSVVAVSSVLLDRLAPTAPSIVVPNGIDASVWGPRASEPPELAALPRPIVAYAGTVDDRLDAGAVRAVADAVAGGTVLLMGPLGRVHPMAELSDLTAVRYLGVLPQARLAAVLQHVDACIMPHHRTPLTEAMCPLKLMDYLASGQPVAATDLPTTYGHGNRVVPVGADDDWGAAVHEALRKGRATDAERYAFVTANSWRIRHRALIDLALEAGDSNDPE
jgi:glycosyltransferase involved in cell wall biosynthesis